MAGIFSSFCLRLFHRACELFIAFLSICATCQGGFRQDPHPNAVRIKWFTPIVAAAPGIPKHFNYLHLGLLRRVGVPVVVCAPRFVHCSCFNDTHLAGRLEEWISLVFWASLDRHIQRRTPSLHHSSRKSHCLCAAFACGGNLGPGVWFGLRFRLGSDCVSVSVEVPIGVCFGRNFEYCNSR